MVQQTVAKSPIVQQQPIQTPTQSAQVIQVPAMPGPSVPTNIQTPQGNVIYIKLPPGITKGTYNLRSVPLDNSMVVKTPTANTTTPVSVGRGKTNTPSKAKPSHPWCNKYSQN